MTPLVEQFLSGEEALLANPSLRFHTIVAAYPWGTESFRRALIEPVGTDSFRRALLERGRRLGIATLSYESLRLLCSLLLPHVSDISAHLLWHDATMSAQQTQQVLPPGVAVLKSVTLKIGERIVLATGVGDFRLHRETVRTLIDELCLPKRALKHVTINPELVDPSDLYGLAQGMVSPFFSASKSVFFSALALVQNDSLSASEYSDVAVSLSRFESLLIPQPLFPLILSEYVRVTYPHLRLIHL